MKDQQVTRRGMLSVISSIYDPFGLTCQFFLQGKKLLQGLCQVMHGWDEMVLDNICQKWKVCKSTVCSCHVTYVFQSESTLYSCLNIKELFARSRREIGRWIDCNWTRTENHLVLKSNTQPFGQQSEELGENLHKKINQARGLWHNKRSIASSFLRCIRRRLWTVNIFTNG